MHLVPNPNPNPNPGKSQFVTYKVPPLMHTSRTARLYMNLGASFPLGARGAFQVYTGAYT
jgi:hypothetical protein